MNDELLLRVLTGHATPEDLAVLAAWKAADSENAQSIAALEETLRRIASWYNLVDPIPSPSVADLIRRAQRQHVSREFAEARASTRRSIGPLLLPLSVAAAVVLMIGGVFFVRSFPRTVEQRVKLSASELRSEASGLGTTTLSDGTTIKLGPNSHVRVEPSDVAREIWLDGRATFSVAHVASVPFRVRTSLGQVEDLGTRFVAETDGSVLHVAVFEGRAAVSALGVRIELGPGDVATTFAGFPPRVVRRGDHHSSDEWLRAALTIEDEPLTEVAEVFELRYHYHIRIADSAVATRTVTAWFVSAPKPRDALDGICRAAGVVCSLSDSGAVIHGPAR